MYLLPGSGIAGVSQALSVRSKKIVTGLPTAPAVPHSEPGTIWGKAGRETSQYEFPEAYKRD